MSKITFLLTQDLESPSGLGRYWPMARYLAALGHQVKIGALHSNFNSLSKSIEKINNVSIHYLAQMHVLKKGSTKIYFPFWKLITVAVYATLKFICFILSDTADIVYVGKPHPMNGIAGIVAKITKKSKLFLDCDDYEKNINHFQNPLQKWIVSFFERILPFFADLIITNTMFTQQRLISAGISPKKVILIPNGIDIERFIKPSDMELEKLREELGLHKGWKIIGFIGTLGLTSHPVDLLIEAFKKVHQVIPNTKLLLVGGGEDINSLIQISNKMNLQNDILFTGRVPPDQIVKYYHLMDVSVDPVYDDLAAKGRSPLKMFESWACGVPFVTGDVGDRRMLSGEPPSSFIIKPGDSGELAKGILAILTEPSLSDKFRDLGKKRSQDFYWENIISNQRHLFEVKNNETT